MQLNENNVVVGMKVVINDKIGHYVKRFTKGKVYEVLAIGHSRETVQVQEDDGDKPFVYMHRFNIFEEKKVRYWKCMRGSITVAVGELFRANEIIGDGAGRLLIKGRWQSINRFRIVELPEQVAPKKEEKPAPPPPKSLAQLLKEAQDKERRIGMCSYAIMNDKGVVKYQVNDICHARIRPYTLAGEFTGVSLMVEAHAVKIRNNESPEAEALYLRAIDYILHRSPWSSVFTNKDFKKNFGCVDLDVNRGVNAVACAAIALRTCSEYTANNTVFCALADAGVNEHIAYIVAHGCMNKGVGNNTGGHHVFSGNCLTTTVLEFFKTGKFLDEGTPYKDNKNRYLIVAAQFTEDLHQKHREHQLGTKLIDIAAKCNTIKKGERWGSVIYLWETPNNLIPLAQQLEKEFHNV